MIPIRGWLVLALSSLVLMATCSMARAEKPSAWLCWQARGAVAVYGSEKAAEEAARRRGVSEVVIASAKRCRR